MIIQTTGVLEYGPGMKAVVLLDPGIGAFYRSLVPKSYYVQMPMYQTHLTVVRLGIEEVKNAEHWGKYQGEVVPITYDNIIWFDGTYFYLDAQSDRLGDIRVELGLPRFRFGDLGADRQCYHITIGNVKRV